MDFCLGLGPFNIPPHFPTYFRATCKIWTYSDAPKRVFPRNPDLWARTFCPFDCLRTTVDQWSFLLVCVWLVHGNMLNHVGDHVYTRFHVVSSPEWDSVDAVLRARDRLPPRFCSDGVARWNFLLVCVWLVHMVMPNHFGAQVVP